MTDFYTIWKQDGNQDPVLMKVNMTIGQATEYITYERQDLPQGERFFTENQETSKVDMFFTTDYVITPDKPMFIKNGKLSTNKSKPKMMNPQISKNKIGYDFISSRRKSKPTKSRGKWIGNMFKSSNKRLQNISRTGTSKQKSLARKILNNRRK